QRGRVRARALRTARLVGGAQVVTAAGGDQRAQHVEAWRVVVVEQRAVLHEYCLRAVERGGRALDVVVQAVARDAQARGDEVAGAPVVHAVAFAPAFEGEGDRLPGRFVRRVGCARRVEHEAEAEQEAPARPRAHGEVDGLRQLA